MGTWARHALVGTTILFATAEARADGDAHADARGTHGARWVVEVDATCEKHRALFEREISLACDAMATCRITSRRQAELEATLQCDGGGSGAWRLQTRTVEGTELGSVELNGTTPDDRMREAAMEIARDAAPERTLATESLRHTLTPNDGDKLKLEPAALPKLSMSTSGFVSDRAKEGLGFGARVAAGLRIASATHFTLGLAGSGGGSGADSFRRIRGGAGIAFGAPFNVNLIGVLFEGGVDGTQSYDRSALIGNATTLPAQSRMAAYLQQAIVFMVPGKYVRPYSSFTVTLLSSAPNLSATVDLGLAFPIF